MHVKHLIRDDILDGSFNAKITTFYKVQPSQERTLVALSVIAFHEKGTSESGRYSLNLYLTFASTHDMYQPVKKETKHGPKFNL